MVDISRARLERSVETNTGVVDSGAAQVYGTLSQRLQEFSNRQMKEYADQRIAQGSKEGAQASAGKLTGPVPEGDTMYNQAYREAAIAGYAASIKTEVVGQRSMMEAQFSTDPEGFASQFDGFSKGMLKGVDPELRPIVMQELAVSRNSALARITSNKIEQDTKNAITDIEIGIETTKEEAIKAASDLDTVALEHNLAQLKASLNLMVARGAKTRIEADDIQSDFLKEIDNSITLGAFDKARKQGKGLSFLSSFSKNPPEDLLPEEVDNLALRMQTMLSRDIWVKGIQESQSNAYKDRISKAQTIAIQRDFLSKAHAGTLTTEEVLNSSLPPFGQGGQDAFLGMIEASGGAGWDKTSGPVFLRLKDDIMNGNITEESEILPFIGRGVNRTDGDYLMGQVTKKNNPFKTAQEEKDALEEDQLDKFENNMKGVVQGVSGFMGIPDPARGEQYYRYQRDLRIAWDKKKEKGEDPTTLIDPNSPDYFGTPEKVRNYQRTGMQIMDDKLEQLETAKKDMAAKKKPGQSMEDFAKEHPEEIFGNGP